ARGVERTPELVVRAAIGASRGRIVAQLLTESATLASLGGVLGAALGAALLRLGVGLAPADWPRLDQVHFSGAVVGFAIAVTALAVLMFGLAPAVALAVVILAGAGLVGRSLAHIDDIDLGFAPRQHLIAGLELMVAPTSDTAAMASYAV